MKVRRALKIAFLDRDGTLIYEPPDTKQIDTLAKLKILPGVIRGLLRLQKDGYKLVMVSNQDGLGTPKFPAEKFEVVQRAMLRRFKEEGVSFYKIFICPHWESDSCECRKPKQGLVADFLKAEPVDLGRSFVIGDRDADLEFGKNIGIKGFKIKTNANFSLRRKDEAQNRVTDGQFIADDQKNFC